MSYRPLWLCALLGQLACRSAGTAPQPSPTAEGSPTDSRPPAAIEGATRQPPHDSRPHIEHAKTCAPDSVTIAEAGICLRLPPDYAAAPPLPGLQTFEAPGAPPITLRWQPTTAAFTKTHTDAVARLAELDSAALTDRTRDGTGAFVYAVETQPHAYRVAHAASTLQSATTIAWCSASAPLHADQPRAFFEACQTMMVAGAFAAQRR